MKWGEFLSPSPVRIRLVRRGPLEGIVFLDSGSYLYMDPDNSSTLAGRTINGACARGFGVPPNRTMLKPLLHRDTL